MKYGAWIAAGLVVAILAAPALAADKWKNVSTAKILEATDNPDKQARASEVQFLEIDEDQNIWVGTLEGLIRMKDGKAQPIRDAGGKIIHRRFWDVQRVGKDDYWLAAQGGAYHLKGDTINTHLPKNNVAQVLPYNLEEGTLIAKVDDSVMKFEKGEWSKVEFFEEKENQPEILYRTKDGRVWVSTEANGVFVMDPAKPDAPYEHYLKGTVVKELYQDSKDRVWCGMWDKGVMMYDPAKPDDGWVRFLAKPTRDSYILNIEEDAKGQIWVATNDKGAFIYDGTEWVNLLREERAVNMLETTRDGRVWISTQAMGGLRYWDPKSNKWVVSMASVLPIRDMVETADGTIWAGGILDGLHVLQK